MFECGLRAVISPATIFYLTFLVRIFKAMTIVLPEDYHAKAALESSRVECITNTEALKEDIRALRVGILNIMPKVESYEFSLLQPLGRSIMQIEPVWIRLKTHNYLSSDKNHLEKMYVPFEEAVGRRHLDGLIVTGAPVEEIPYEGFVLGGSKEDSKVCTAEYRIDTWNLLGWIGIGKVYGD